MTEEILKLMGTVRERMGENSIGGGTRGAMPPPPDFTDSRLLCYILIIVVVNFKVCEISEISWPPQGFLGSSTYEQCTH